MKIRIFLYSGLLFSLVSCLHDNSGEDASLFPPDSAAMDSAGSSVFEVDSLPWKLEALSNDSVLKHASFSYLIYDATDSVILAEKNPDISLVPASTIKLFTSAAALELLGPGTRYRTRLLYQGDIVNGVLNGNLIIRGSGDPTFCYGGETMNNVFAAWANAVAILHIDSVNGNIIGDGRIFPTDNIPYTWSWGEINQGYCAAPSGLSVNGNLFSLAFDPSQKGWLAFSPDEMIPEDPTAAYKNQVVAYEADEEVYLIGSPRDNEKLIRGTAKPGVSRKEIIGVIHKPALVTANEFRKKLIEKGISVSGIALDASEADSLFARDSTGSIHDIATVWSPTVNSLVYNVNHHSNNFFAETLLKQLGVKMYRYGSTEAGIKAVRSFLQSKHMDLSGFYMYDGSGISRYNAITARHLVSLLDCMQTSPVSESFRTSLAVAGVSGTMAGICTNPDIAGKISGKSGTMSRVRSYAGYATSSNGHRLIFAIIVNNFTCSSLEMRSKIEEVLSDF